MKEKWLWRHSRTGEFETALSASITGGDLAIWTAAIAGGSAVIAGLVGTLGGLWASARTLRANGQLARESFLREKQADAYVMVANHLARVRAWANIAIDEAKGNSPRFSPKPEFWIGDEWFEMSAQLRVFGSLMARVQFDEMHGSAMSLQNLVRRYSAGNPGEPSEVDASYQLVNEMVARLIIVLTAELGPLGDELKSGPRHWWQFKKKKLQRRRLEASVLMTRSRAEPTSSFTI